MQLPKNTTIAVADGTKLHLYRNTGDEAHPKLAALPEPAIGGDNKSAGVRHSSSSANPNDSRLEEASFAAATADWLNKEVLGHRIDDLVVIAAPKSLGELRKHYHKALQGKLLGELAKDLTGHSVADIEATLAKA